MGFDALKGLRSLTPRAAPPAPAAPVAAASPGGRAPAARSTYESAATTAPVALTAPLLPARRPLQTVADLLGTAPQQPPKPARTGAQQEAFDALSPEQRAQFDAEYQAADAPTRAAMDHSLEQGLADDYLAQPQAERAKYVELFTSAGARTGPLEQVDGLLADGELSSFLSLEAQVDPWSLGGLALEGLLFDGTLRLTDASGTSSLDYLAGFASAPGETTPPPASVPRNAHLENILSDLASDQSLDSEGANDCASIQGMAVLAAEHPASFVRFQTELAQEGETRVGGPDGEQVLTYRGPPAPGEGGRIDTTQGIYNQAVATLVDRSHDLGGRTPEERALNRMKDAMDGTTGAEMAAIVALNAAIAYDPSENGGKVDVDYGVITVPQGDELSETTPERAAQLAQLARETLDQQLEAGNTVQVLVENEDGPGHWVTVSRVEGRGDVVYQVDTGHGPRDMTESEFETFMATVGAVVYDKADSPNVPAGSYNKAWDDLGAGAKLPTSDPGELRIMNT